MVRIRDAYLSAFAELAPHAGLVTTLELACRVAKVARALVWTRILALAGDSMDRFRQAPLETMIALLDEGYVGALRSTLRA